MELFPTEEIASNFVALISGLGLQRGNDPFLDGDYQSLHFPLVKDTLDKKKG